MNWSAFQSRSERSGALRFLSLRVGAPQGGEQPNSLPIILSGNGRSIAILSVSEYNKLYSLSDLLNCDICILAYAVIAADREIDIFKFVPPASYC